MARKPKALALCFFPAFTPPSSGGEMRLGGLYRELARHYDVTLLTSTDFGARFEEIRHGAGFRELRFPKDEFWRKAFATLDASGVSGDLSPLAFALAVSEPACELRRVALELAKTTDVIHSRLSLFGADLRGGRARPEIYTSHNVEASLLSSIVRGPGFEAAWLKLLRIEGNLIRRAQKVFATSEADAEIFRLLYGAAPEKLFLCPNGYSEEEIGEVAALRTVAARDGQKPPALLFTGSGHHPNVEAAGRLLALARHLPECRFIVAGGVCGAIESQPRSENVELFGRFTPKQKQELLAGADLYINPVVLGSGTSLKAVEALAAHLPMISTPEGVRGLGLTPDRHAVIVQREDFVVAIRRVLADSALRERIAAEGRERAQAQFCWSAIADRLAADLSGAEQGRSRAPQRPERPLVLAFNDYSLAGLQSGGAARVGNLLGNLGCDVVLTTFSGLAHVGLIEDGMLQIGVPKSADHFAFEAAVNAGQAVSVNDGVAALFVAANRALREIVARLAPRAQALIFEHPYMAPVLDELRRLRPDAPVIYSAHNVEAELKPNLLRRHPLARSLVAFTAELERRLVTRADLIVCCTDADRSIFAKMTAAHRPRRQRLPDRSPRMDQPRRRRAEEGGLPGLGPRSERHRRRIYRQAAGAHVPAGALRDHRNGLRGARGACAGECGSSWCGAGPGQDLPDAAMGPGAESARHRRRLQPEAARLHGERIADAEHGGRGARLQGRRARRRTHRAAGRVSRRPEADAGRSAGLAEQRARARAYAEGELSWAAAAAGYRAALEPLLRPAAPRPPRRLLVVTYRYTEPSRGGAEEYLIEVLKRLRGRFDRIDLAAVDVERIENRHHFGCELTEGPGAAGRIGELFDNARYFPFAELAEAEMLERARDLERVWASEEFHLLAPFAKILAHPRQPRLFSGFYGLEAQNGAVCRWTAGFLFPYPPRTRVCFTCAAWHPSRKPVPCCCCRRRATVRRSSASTARHGSRRDSICISPFPKRPRTASASCCAGRRSTWRPATRVRSACWSRRPA